MPRCTPSIGTRPPTLQGVSTKFQQADHVDYRQFASLSFAWPKPNINIGTSAAIPQIEVMPSNPSKGTISMPDPLGDLARSKQNPDMPSTSLLRPSPTSPIGE
jgi:hypothetical protein